MSVIQCKIVIILANVFLAGMEFDIDYEHTDRSEFIMQHLQLFITLINSPPHLSQFYLQLRCSSLRLRHTWLACFQCHRLLRQPSLQLFHDSAPFLQRRFQLFQLRRHVFQFLVAFFHPLSTLRLCSAITTIHTRSASTSPPLAVQSTAIAYVCRSISSRFSTTTSKFHLFQVEVGRQTILSGAVGSRTGLELNLWAHSCNNY